LILFSAYLGYKVYHKQEYHFVQEAAGGAKSVAKEYNPEEQKVPERNPSASNIPQRA
jgi:hypothetical protein